jgi:hypothetical protein
LQTKGLWRIISGEYIKPSHPKIPVTDDNKTPIQPTAAEKDKYFTPQSEDTAYIQRFYRFLVEHEKYQTNISRATGIIQESLSPTIAAIYRDHKYDDPKELWDPLAKENATQTKVDGAYQQKRLINCRLEDHGSVTKWLAEQERCIADLAVCGIKVDEPWRIFWTLENLPKTQDWEYLKMSMRHGGKDTKQTDIIDSLRSHEAGIRRKHGLSNDAALFVTKRERGQKPVHSKQDFWHNNNSKKPAF